MFDFVKKKESAVPVFTENGILKFPDINFYLTSRFLLFMISLNCVWCGFVECSVYVCDGVLNI